MVYKIRNKSIFWTKSGYKNNYFGKVTIAARPSNPDTVLAVTCRYDHMSFLVLINPIVIYLEIANSNFDYLDISMVIKSSRKLSL